MEDAVHRPMTVQELVRHIQRFQGDCAHSRSVEERWLCTFLQPALDAACEVGDAHLNPENRASANAFRAAEIEKELDRKRRDIEALERDLKKARVV